MARESTFEGNYKDGVLSGWWKGEHVASWQGSRPKTDKLKKNMGGKVSRCSQCGGNVRIRVSPKRNPHSSKLGKAVMLKDHDLCRPCWRRAIREAREMLELTAITGSSSFSTSCLIKEFKDYR